MTPLSVAIVTLNEEKNIGRSLESVKWADEIVVVDSHSTDRTVEIARRYTDRVIRRDWPGHIAQKNFAIDSASHDWVLVIDADEEVSPELRSSIHRQREAGFDAEGYRFRRRTRYLGRWIRHGGWYPDYKERLFDRRRGRFGGADPHARVRIDGRLKTLAGDLLHYTYDDVTHHVQLINRYATDAARQMHARGVRPRLWRMLLRPAARFVTGYLLRAGFMDGRAGLHIALTNAYYVWLKYFKLWEMQQSRTRDRR